MAIEITPEYMESVATISDYVEKLCENETILPEDLFESRIEAHLRKCNVTDEEALEDIEAELKSVGWNSIIVNMEKNIRRAMVAMLVDAMEEVDNTAKKLVNKAK